jgi:dihydropteroate synthase
MGVLNVTPDSFSDGGAYLDPHRAIERGKKMEEEGADFIDIGGESSRPGSDPVQVQEELRRVLPVVEQLSRTISIPISIDTYKSEVARAALDAGAEIVNDISGMSSDPEMFETASAHDACVVLMHMKGNPKIMQDKPTYTDVVNDVSDFLRQRAEEAVRHGLRRLILDPGIGFGKTLEHNLRLMKELKQLTNLRYPILIGVSRKSFIGKLLDLPVEDRLEGTAAAVTASILRGANIVRVHDVRQMKRIAIVADALKDSPSFSQQP